MLAWLASGAAKAVLGVFGDTFVKPFVEAYAVKKNVDLEKFRAQSQENQVLGIGVINAEVQRIKSNTDIIQAGMQHRIWWWGWTLFVIPVGIYHASIFLLSTLGIEPGTFAVLRVPPMQEQWAMWIVLSIFGAQTASGIVSTIADKIGKK